MQQRDSSSNAGNNHTARCTADGSLVRQKSQGREDLNEAANTMTRGGLALVSQKFRLIWLAVWITAVARGTRAALRSLGKFTGLTSQGRTRDQLADGANDTLEQLDSSLAGVQQWDLASEQQRPRAKTKPPAFWGERRAAAAVAAEVRIMSIVHTLCVSSCSPVLLQRSHIAACFSQEEPSGLPLNPHSILH